MNRFVAQRRKPMGFERPLLTLAGIAILQLGATLASNAPCAAIAPAPDERIVEEYEGGELRREFTLVQELAIDSYCVQRWDYLDSISYGRSIVRGVHVDGDDAEEVFRRTRTHFQLDVGAEQLGFEAGQDITGNGKPNLVVTSITGGDCCYQIYILEFGDELSLIYDDHLRTEIERPLHPAGGRIDDIDGDGRYEVVLREELRLGANCPELHGIVLYSTTVFAYHPLLGTYAMDNSTYPEAYADEIARGLAIAQYDGSYDFHPNPWSREWGLVNLRDFVPSPQSDKGELCSVAPLVTALYTSGREMEAWEAFDDYYSGADGAADKSFLQHALLTGIPWHNQPSLADLAGTWQGEMADYSVSRSQTEPFDLEYTLLGGGTPIDLELYGDSQVGEVAGMLLMYVAIGELEPLRCPLVRDLELGHHHLLRETCERGRTILLRFEPTSHRLGLTVLTANDVAPAVHSNGIETRAYSQRAPDYSPPNSESPRHAELATELARLSCAGISLERNEIYARRGWVFGAGAIADYFASQDWYVPRGWTANREASNATVLADLSQAEIADARTLLAYESYLGCTGEQERGGRPTAGFDCQEAVLWDERVVCNNRPIANLDLLMTAVYEDLKTELPARADELTSDQQRWLADRSACETEPNPLGCLREVYTDRLAELRQLFLAY